MADGGRTPAAARRVEADGAARPLVSGSGSQRLEDDAEPELTAAGPGALDARLLLLLQHKAGNGAVAQLVAQRRTHTGPATDPKSRP